MYNALLKKVNHDQKKKKKDENRLKKLISRKNNEDESRKKESLPDEAKDYTKILEPLAAYMLEVGPEKSRKIRIVGAVEKIPETEMVEEST